MARNHGRGGCPEIHRKGKQLAQSDISRSLHPRHLEGWLDRLRGHRATRVRAELQAAVEWSVLEYGEAEWVYQQLRVGTGWYCVTLDQGRGWKTRGSSTANLVDPTIPQWWFER